MNMMNEQEITETVKKELKANFNPEGSELRNFQLQLLEILRYVVDVCERNGLTYWLSGGTLLGAYLYKGFIPWDDDVDIDMPYADYRKFCQIVKKEKRYFLQDKSSDIFYPYYYGKVRDEGVQKKDKHPMLSFSPYSGIFIDVIPVERCNRTLKKISFLLMCGGQYKLMKLAGKFRVFKSLLYLRHGINLLFLCLFRFISGFSKKNLFYDTYSVGDCRHHVIDEAFTCMKMDFEGLNCNVPVRISEYLDEWYHGADYHYLPDISDVGKYQHYDW